MNEKIKYAIDCIELALDGEDVVDHLTDAISNLQAAINEIRDSEGDTTYDKQHRLLHREII